MHRNRTRVWDMNAADIKSMKAILRINAGQVQHTKECDDGRSGNIDQQANWSTLRNGVS